MDLVPNSGIPNAEGSGSTSSGLASPHEPTKYTLRCVVDNEGETFTVDIMSDNTIETLKRLVQEVAEDSLSGVHYRKLILYKVNILDKGNIIDVNNILSTPTPIKVNADKVFEYFGSSSVDKTINTIAQKPSKE
ncbi:hypothetical protein BGZ79_007468, partial [Entomortierella chlamydospora]